MWGYMPKASEQNVHEPNRKNDKSIDDILVKRLHIGDHLK